jgi:hypothetical protein
MKGDEELRKFFLMKGDEKRERLEKEKILQPLEDVSV